MSDPDVEVFRQPLVSRGIVVGDDVWVGSHVVIVDGVTVGDHSVLGAGAIVTKDVPAGAVVGGNPARILRWRIPPAAGPNVVRPARDLAGRVAALAETARAQASDILQRSWDAETGLFVDRAGVAPTMRAQCDAIELADLLLERPPPQVSRDRQVRRLMGWQLPETGAVPLLRTDGSAETDADSTDPDVAYHVLCAGYALDLLGERLPHPIRLPALSSAAATTDFLEGLPWSDQAWNAGHWVDALSTALHWSRLRGDPTRDGVVESLIGWLVTRNDPETGMWGRPTPDAGLLEVVNGSYRATRGTFAQWGIPLPRPERVIDTVLRHTGDERYFRADRQNACNVLDVAHPLWLTQATGYRSAEVESTARRLLEQALEHWTDGAGFGFRAPAAGPAADGTVPGLRGTEMWLATIWYLADVAGVSDVLGYRPRGIHRPEPVPAFGH